MTYIVLKSEYSNISDKDLDVIIPVALVDSYKEAEAIVLEGNSNDALHVYWVLPLEELHDNELEYFRTIMQADCAVIVSTLQNDFAIISDKKHYGPFDTFEDATDYCMEELGLIYWELVDIEENV